MTEAAKRLRARAAALRATAAKHEVAFGARADCCAEYAADVCDELAADLDALPAEPVEAVESACAWLDQCGEDDEEAPFIQIDNADGWRESETIDVTGSHQTLSACIIATARALGWTLPAEPVERWYTRAEVLAFGERVRRAVGSVEWPRNADDVAALLDAETMP